MNEVHFCDNPKCEKHQVLVPDGEGWSHIDFYGNKERNLIITEFNGLTVDIHFCNACYHAAFSPPYFHPHEQSGGPVCDNHQCKWHHTIVSHDMAAYSYYETKKFSLAMSNMEHEVVVKAETIQRVKFFDQYANAKYFLCECCATARDVMEGKV